jgi:hypothetical protein
VQLRGVFQGELPDQPAVLGTASAQRGLNDAKRRVSGEALSSRNELIGAWVIFRVINRN